MFPEPDHAPEGLTKRSYAKMRDGDPYWAPDGEYPEWLPKFLYDAYNRAMNRDAKGISNPGRPS